MEDNIQHLVQIKKRKYKVFTTKIKYIPVVL